MARIAIIQIIRRWIILNTYVVFLKQYLLYFYVLLHMIFNFDKINLDDAVFFMDQRLDHLNVYSVVIVTDAFDTNDLVVEFVSYMRKYSFVQMLQETSDYSLRFTFVSSVNCRSFSKCVDTLCLKLSEVYKCNVFAL